MRNTVQLIECPRDAMQGWPSIIATQTKIDYLNQLLRVGFHTLDFGSFVSAKAIPQMADTKDVVKGLVKKDSTTQLLAIVANERGADDALEFLDIDILGFPFSVSPTFQQRNANSTIEESFVRVKNIQQRCVTSGRQLVVYLSMGYGNPYNDAYSTAIVQHWAEKIASLGVNTISIADTVGLASPETVKEVTQAVIEQLPELTIGVHLHAAPQNRWKKLEAAWQAGCRRFDGALNGIGGCPMAGSELVGNMDTVDILSFLHHQGVEMPLNEKALTQSMQQAQTIFQ